MQEAYKVQRRRLVDQVLKNLQSIIQSGKYSIGQKLPTETELMQMFDVGRSTVREAVKILVHASVLEVRQGDGTYVIALPIETFQSKVKGAKKQDIIEVRNMLEIKLAGLAAIHRTEGELHKIKECLDLRCEFLKKGQYSSYVNADIDFHLAICYASHNELMINMYQTLVGEIHQMLSSLILDASYNDNTSFHNNIYIAIQNQNVEDAKFWTEANIKMM
ncbi:FadR/GntR family transcriptional regulator [Gracilibacillus sp. HCP3S3_G5_1]|uniref:FadR/GntR family transcriptional regulator n=1 Tax=unclassified Gracilibacillus TaxID=2625209 RepID=UPI003F891FC6